MRQTRMPGPRWPRLVLLLVLSTSCHNRVGRWAAAGEVTHDIDPPKDVLALAARPLTGAEQAKVRDRGFAILGKGAAQSFHVGYTALFHAHQPVFISADSLLYAWHSSYDKILIAVERSALVPALGALLDDLRGQLAAAEADAQTRADLDVYLTVAASLLRGKQLPPAAGGDATAIGTLFDSGQRAEGQGFELFGKPAGFDFSMLKPRGHYDHDPVLAQYFRAMMWLGRAEVRIAVKSATSPWQINRRALRASQLLVSLFTEKTRARWQLIDDTIGVLVGPADSLSLPGFEAAGKQLGPQPADEQIVAALQGPAAQQIRTQLAHGGVESIAFLLLGQRFVFDSSVFSDLTYGSLATEPLRLMPTPLDIGDAVLHNPVAHALLAPELAKYGAPYAQALQREAARSLPKDSVYHLWLTALRELSPDASRDAALPAPLASAAWGRRLLATQLASWAELRHDNLLYAKQSFTAELGCDFPDAYVDPYPTFYAAMAAMASRARTAISALQGDQTRILTYLDRVTTTMERLRAIAERERANEPLTAADLDFVNHMVSLDARNAVCTTTTDPSGWYAELFFEQKTALWHDPVIADVHTQPTDEAGNDVGRVLHVGTGQPRMIEVRIEHDRGAHARTYRGFVSSYAEVITDHFRRLTDHEWREMRTPAPPWLDAITAR